MRISAKLATETKQIAERAPTPALPALPQSVRDGVRTQTDALARQGRPPFGILGREIDQVLARGRVVARADSSWQDVANLVASLRRLRDGMLALRGPFGNVMVQPNDSRVVEVNEAITTLRQAAADGGVTIP